MKIEVYLDATKLDLSNVKLTDFRQQMVEKKEELAKEEIIVPPFNVLKGDKFLLQKAFLNQKAESLNL
jgi:hypothetical protein